jgi:endonuclease-3 related protein
MSTLRQLYDQMLDAYGPQGWWPLLGHAGTNPTKTGSITGYHPGQYDFPRTDAERFEICVGAILTQNTAWPNVEQALRNLAELDALSPNGIERLDDDALRQAIRPSGYFNMKARKLRELVAHVRVWNGRTPSREELLAVWGIGPETADSIRLYAYGQVEMVVDAYTRRILSHLGLVAQQVSYADLKAFCVAGLPADLIVYQEFHALVVEHAKRHARSGLPDLIEWTAGT